MCAPVHFPWTYFQPLFHPKKSCRFCPSISECISLYLFAVFPLCGDSSRLSPNMNCSQFGHRTRMAQRTHTLCFVGQHTYCGVDKDPSEIRQYNKKVILFDSADWLWLYARMRRLRHPVVVRIYCWAIYLWWTRHIVMIVMPDKYISDLLERERDRACVL